MKSYALLSFVLVTYFGLFGCSSEKNNQNDQNSASTSSPAPQTEELCFLRVTKGEPIIMDNDTTQMIDSLVIELTVKNDSVHGVYNWLPSAKDRMTGSLSGTLQDGIVTAVHTYSAEGTVAREEKIMKISADSIWIKHGELEQKNGVWALKDKSSAKFTESAPKVDCD